MILNAIWFNTIKNCLVNMTLYYNLKTIVVTYLRFCITEN